jgi:hypothetical protein
MLPNGGTQAGVCPGRFFTICVDDRDGPGAGIGV